MPPELILDPHGLFPRSPAGRSGSAVFGLLGNTDSVVVEVSKNGGSTYTVLETFINLSGATSGSRSCNLASRI